MQLTKAIQVIENLSKGNASCYSSLKKLYKSAALSCHPDRDNNQHIAMTDLNKAWNFISNQAREKVESILTTKSAIEVQQNNSYHDPILDHSLYKSFLPSFFCQKTLINSAFNIVNSEKWCDWIDYKFKTVYFSKYQVSIHQYSSSIHITNLANALERGKTCYEYIIGWGLGCDTSGYEKFLNWLDQISPTKCITAVLAHLSITEFSHNRFGTDEAILFNGLIVQRIEIKSSQVFSPFKLDKLKPLTTLPSKPNINHLIRLLANGQYRKLIQQQYLTDDYIFDAESNNGRKVFENPFELIKNLIENKSSCFHLYVRKDVYSFGDHMNDSKTVIPILTNRFSVFDIQENIAQLTMQ